MFMQRSLKKLYKKYVKQDTAESKLADELNIRNVPNFIVGDPVENINGESGEVAKVEGEMVYVVFDDDDGYALPVHQDKLIYTGRPDIEFTPSSYQSSYISDNININTYVPCSHNMDEFKLKNGSIYISSYRGYSKDTADIHGEKEVPTMGCYLDKAWIKERFLSNDHTSINNSKPVLSSTLGMNRNEFRVVHVNWPDRGVIPVEDLDSLTGYLLRKIRNGEIVETGCYGAHGRTGTLLAALLVAEGAMPNEAISQVRTRHCKQAIETKSQEDLVSEFYKHISGMVN